MSPSVVKEENVAKRTRSKVSLNTIPIEVIETLNPTVLPPGLTTDIYETDPEIDNAWEQFLTEYQQPLSKNLFRICIFFIYLFSVLFVLQNQRKKIKNKKDTYIFIAEDPLATSLG